MAEKIMAQETVKIRKVAGSLIISMPVRILESAGLKEGDYVILATDEKEKGYILIGKDH